MPDRVFFIGGPGTLSASAIDSLLKRHYQVAVFSHPTHFDELPTHEVRTYSGDRDRSSDLARAIEDFKPDVVLDFVCYTPAQAEAVLPLVQGKLRQFIFVSTVDVYGYPLSRLPFREDDPWHSETQSTYAENKRGCETVFKARHHPVDFPLTIARPAYSFGPRFILSFMSRDQGIHMLRRLQTGRPVMVPGDGTTLMHAGSAYNTGCMIAALVDAPQAIGKDYTCGHSTFTTHTAYLNGFARALGVKPNVVHIPTDAILSIDHPDIRSCLLPALTRYNVAFSMDRFLRDFPEFRWEISLQDWTRRVVEWNLQNHTLAAGDDPIIDDRIIECWNIFQEKLLTLA